MGLRFTPSLEQLGDRLTPSTVAAAPPTGIWDNNTSQTRQITVIQDMSEPELNDYTATVPGDADARRNLVTLHSVDIGQASGPFLFARDGNSSGM